MKRKRLCTVTLTGIAILSVIFALTGCATQGLVTPDQMSPQGKAAFVLQLYNNADSNYRAQFAATPAPMAEDMKQYFRTYKAVLENSAPVIDLYASTVKSGGLPTPDQEQQLLTIIYKLQAMLVKKGG
jgi:hypothetical protein